MKAAALRACTTLLRVVPERPARWIARLAGTVCWWALRERRRTLEENLRRFLPGTDAGTLGVMSRAMFTRFTLSTLDVLRLPTLRDAQIVALTDCDPRPLTEAMERGRGVIAVCAHLGNWEFGSAYLGTLRYPASAFAEDLSPGVTGAYRTYRGVTGVRTLSARHGVLAAVRALRRGELLIVVGDRVVAGKGQPVPFGSGVREVSQGPARLSLATGAELIYMNFVWTTPAAVPRYRLGMTRIAREPDDTVETLTARIARTMSADVQAHPDQWFVFQPEWLDVPERPTARASRATIENIGNTQRTRGGARYSS